MQSFKILLISALWLLSASTYSQSSSTARISGTISSDSGEAMIGVIVQLKNTLKGAQTDLNGHYSVEEITPGSYTILFSYLGYRKDSIHVHLHHGQSLHLNKTMHTDTTAQNEILITGKSEIQELKESGFTVNVVDVTRLANTTADLNQVLNRTSGVKVREEGGMGSNFNFAINGLSGKQVKFFIDGVPMDVMGSTMTLNNIPVNLAERMEVYKGAVPVSLGSDALGGAVNIITNQKVKSYLDASYSYGSFNSHRAALTGQYTQAKTGLVFKGSGFYNYSDNNYIMKDVEIWDAAANSYVKKEVRRFHDRYKSAMGQFEMGVMNKKWADVFFIGASASLYNQQIQTGFRQDNVIGMATRDGNAYNGSVRYRKDNIVKGLNINFYGSRSIDKFAVTDTMMHKYSWDGTYSADKMPTAELGGAKTITQISRPRTYARMNLSYKFNTVHSFNLNYTFDHTKNLSYNELLTDKDEIPGILGKHVVGLAYQQDLFNQRLTNTFFGKFYGSNMEQKKWVNNEYVKQSDFFSNFGYGIATRYRITKDMGARLSYEYAYRLLEVEELFGNGMTIIGNTDLKPETSSNINAGLYQGFKKNKHSLFIELSAFYRDAKDFIYGVPDIRSGQMKYENKSSVRITGLEGEVKYNYDEAFALTLNATYQNAINTTKYSSTSTTTPEATYLNRIPNQPWFFANIDLSMGKNNVFGKDTRLQFNWYTQYVHWFYLTWEAYGNKAGKADIPTQLIHTASATYSLKKGKYNISIECRNLTDNLAYDNYRLQKPGRAFYLKFRYFIK